MSEENKIRDAADAIKGLVEAVPVYEDALQPAAREIGRALQTIAKTVHIVLAPVSALVWGYDKIKDFVSTAVAEKLSQIPIERLQTPAPNVACPLLEALRYTGHEETLRDMYANLLAASMDTQTAFEAHPSFVDIIKQISPDEARLLKIMAVPQALPLLEVRWEYTVQDEDHSGGQYIQRNFSILGYQSGCTFPELTPRYLDNICRLGLGHIDTLFEYTGKGVYDELEQHQMILDLKNSFDEIPDRSITIKRRGLQITDLGEQFIKICVTP
jgi:hypothetical protein